MTIPSITTDWDNNETNTVEPTVDHKADGWLAPAGVPEKPTFQEFNHWMNNVHKWITWIKDTRYKFLSDYTDLSAFVTAVGVTPTTIVLDANDSSSTTIPNTVTVVPVRGFKADGTVTWNCQVQGNPHFQWLDGINHTFGNPLDCSPFWFGDDIDDGVTPAEDAFNRMITAAYAGSRMEIPSTYGLTFYRLEDDVNIDKSISLLGIAGTVLIKQVTASYRGLYITSSFVDIENIDISGPAGGAVAGEHCIEAAGTAITDISNINIKNCSMGQTGAAGIKLSYVNKFLIDDVRLFTVGDACIQLGYCSKGSIRDCQLEPGLGSTIYSIELFHVTDTDDVNNNISIHDNRFYSSVNAIYVQGGEEIHISDNIIKDCFSGIVLDTHVNTTYTHTPQNCIISNNEIHRGTTGNGVGVGVYGVSDTNVAYNVQVLGNSITNMGNASVGAVTATYTSNCKFNNNTLIDSAYYGFNIASWENIEVSNNTITNILTAVAPAGIGLRFEASGTLNHEGSVSNNIIDVPTQTAFHFENNSNLCLYNNNIIDAAVKFGQDVGASYALQRVKFCNHVRYDYYTDPTLTPLAPGTTHNIALTGLEGVSIKSVINWTMYGSSASNFSYLQKDVRTISGTSTWGTIRIRLLNNSTVICSATSFDIKYEVTHVR